MRSMTERASMRQGPLHASLRERSPSPGGGGIIFFFFFFVLLRALASWREISFFRFLSSLRAAVRQRGNPEQERTTLDCRVGLSPSSQ